MVRKINIEQRITFCIIFFLLLTASTCKKNEDCQEGSNKTINVVNNSLKTINWRYFTSDSTYFLNGPPYNNLLNYNESYTYSYKTCWEEYFKTVNNGYRYFLIFDNDTVQAIGWQAISGTNRGLLKRVKVDLNYLNENDFTITYP